MSEFVPQKTCSYVGKHDLHHGEMTVRETLNVSGSFLGIGTKYNLLAELLRREKDAGIKPDPEIDAFMKATTIADHESSHVTNYLLKVFLFSTCYTIKIRQPINPTSIKLKTCDVLADS